MGKVLTTKRSVMRGNKCFAVGYCNLQNLLRFEQPIAFTCSSTYGWNADIYRLDKWEYPGVAIVTGYRPFGKPIPYSLCKEYDGRAADIHSRAVAHGGDPMLERQEMDRLIGEFAERIMGL